MQATAAARAGALRAGEGATRRIPPPGFQRAHKGKETSETGIFFAPHSPLNVKQLFVDIFKGVPCYAKFTISKFSFFISTTICASLSRQ